ncbi:hypothetical protein [Salinisphaera sp. S4-8]|uniref:hypothetical protein n=1 Tax=Salinisphaera sp. S4-8 TaxID=633357 RepID=UPI003340D6BB
MTFANRASMIDQTQAAAFEQASGLQMNANDREQGERQVDCSRRYERITPAVDPDP